MAAEQTYIKVAVRVRPYNKRELEQNQRSIIKVMDRSTLLFDPDEEDDEFFFQGTKQNYRDITKRVNKKLSMDFDRVFDTENTNLNIFEECTAPLVDSVLNGYNCSVFVYGATGAGKTFTMLGNDSCPGLTFLTMRDLFEKIESQQDVRKFDVGVSYLEVYNEQVMNLLTKTGPLKLREDSHGVVVSGLVLTPIYSAEELLRLLALGNANRTQHPTDANAESSRSHAVFQVHIRMTERKTNTKRTVKLSMIDLAGSERAASTKGLGLRFKEGASINKSLLALGNCINKLADGLKHIPYRDSNLTRLLKDSLGGNCRTLMVANISMSSLTYEDTYNTLKYASRAKKIRTTLRQNAMKSNMPKEFFVKKVTEVTAENERLVEKNNALEARLALLEKNSNRRVYDDVELKSWYGKIDAAYASMLKTQENVFALRSKIKNLSNRHMLKEDFENFRKILHKSKRVFQEDFIRYRTYLTTLTKQREQHQEELPRWCKKLCDAIKELDKIKREARGAKCADILHHYLRYKDMEVQNAKQNMSNKHLCSINRELVENFDKIGKAFSVACEVLQQTQSGLESAEQLTPGTERNFEKLYASMAFKESDESVRKSDALEELLQSRRLHSSEEEDTNVQTSIGIGNATIVVPTSAQKRARSKRHAQRDTDFELEADSSGDTDSDSGAFHLGVSDSLFKKPRNLNQTQVVSYADDEYSSGFETTTSTTSHKSTTSTTSSIPAHTTKGRAINSRLISDMLSDQNVRTRVDREKIKHALMKSDNFSRQDLQRTVAVAKQKENIKYNSNCVRKSPRAIVAKVLSGTTTLARKPMSRLAGAISGTKEAPQVRINRAASFRVKK